MRSPGPRLNLDLTPSPPPGIFRRLALGAWRGPRDPSAYATLDVRMERALAFLETHRSTAGRRLTLTHLVAKAAADALRRYPEANALLRWGHLAFRREVGVCVMVVQPAEQGRADLTTAVVHRADALSLEDFAASLEARVTEVRARRDAAIELGKRRSSLVPGFLLGWTLRLLSFVWFTLNLDLRWVGMPKDPFGSVVVTSLGTLGLERGFVAMAPYTRVPLVLAPGAVRLAPVVEGEAVVPGQVLTLTCTYDARVLEVEVVARVLRHVGAALEDPGGAWGSTG